MKKYLYILSLVISLPFISGCTDWLDIKPESEIVLDDFWQSESQATQVVAACYKAISEDGVVRRMIVWGESRSDNMVEGSSINNDLRKILDVDINASNSFSNWANFYEAINYCNTFLFYGPTAVQNDANFTMGKYKALEAEVLTIRALMYFYMVRAFKEVPLILKPSINDTQDYSQPKATERAILDQIITDLKEAENFARDKFEGGLYPKARITKNAVRALLADIYLWDQQYDLCIEQCNKILMDESLLLEESDKMFVNVFYRGSSTESIFELVYNDNELRNSAVRSLYGYEGDVSGQLSFPVFLTKAPYSPFNFTVGSTKEAANDIRYKDFLNINLSALGYFYIFKYAGVQRIDVPNSTLSSYVYAVKSPSWVVYRLSDAILMKAEALVQLNRSENDLKEALALVNQTYLRANPDLDNDSLKISTYPDATRLEELVLRERQRELMFEGKRWFDLMRIARRENSTTRVLNYILPKFAGSQSLQYTKMTVLDALYFPILQSELDNNPMLEQNPFYEITGSSSTK